VGEPAIETRALEKSYGARRALRGVDLQVRAGEIFGFLGPNGAGKTTAIRCFLDLIRPSAGSIRVLGFDPQKQPVEVRRRTGYLPGELRLDERRTVRQTLDYLAGLRNDGSALAGKAEASYARLAQQLDLELELPVRSLSKGNKQKVGIVQALMHDPPLLILDEPTAGLDPLMQHKVLDMVLAAKERGSTVFFSSHHLSEVQEVADRVALIRGGRIAEVAETAALMHRSLRRVAVRFREPVAEHGLDGIAGVTVLASDATQVRLEVSGDMGALLARVGELPVAELDTEVPSLEEIFRSYYAEEPVS